MTMQLYQNPIWLRISHWAETKPNDICVKDTSERTLTYGDLVIRVNAVAVELVQRGFAPNDRAFFLARPSIESIIYFLAVMRAGGVIVAADIAMGRASFRSRRRIRQHPCNPLRRSTLINPLPD